MSASESCTSAPCSPLWIAFVTWKNGSSPLMIRQSAEQALIVEQRHHGAEQLRDASAVRGGVDVQHARAAQRLRRARDGVEEIVGRDPGIGRERRLTDVDEVEHEREYGAAAPGQPGGARVNPAAYDIAVMSAGRFPRDDAGSSLTQARLNRLPARRVTYVL